MLMSVASSLASPLEQPLFVDSFEEVRRIKVTLLQTYGQSQARLVDLSFLCLILRIPRTCPAELACAELPLGLGYVEEGARLYFCRILTS